MRNDLNLTEREKSELAGILYDAKMHRSKRHKNTQVIDKVIDKLLGRETLHKKSEIIVNLFNGESCSEIAKGGKFQSEHGIFVIQDIGGNKIKVNGNWHHKAEFEPAKVIEFNGKNMGISR